MERKTTKLKKEIMILIRKINKLQHEIDRIQEQLGYIKFSVVGGDTTHDYLAPELSVSEKVDALYKYFFLEIKKIEKEKKIIVSRKKIRRTKNDSKKQEQSKQ